MLLATSSRSDEAMRMLESEGSASSEEGTKGQKRHISAEKIGEVAEGVAEFGYSSIFLCHLDKFQNVNARYLTGYSGPCIVLLTVDEEVILVPWDVPQAKEFAVADRIIDWKKKEYRFDFSVAWQKVTREVVGKDLVGTPSSITVFMKNDLVKSLPGGEEQVIPDSRIGQLLAKIRATKSPQEIQALKRTGEMTRKIVKKLKEFLMIKNAWSELEIAALIYQMVTLEGGNIVQVPGAISVANATRSYHMHPRPYATKEVFAKRGIGLIDIGVSLDGYCNDLCIPIVGGAPTMLELKMHETIESLVWDNLVEMAKPGVLVSDLADFANNFLKERGFPPIPHSLGHGVGLDIHDTPSIIPVPKVESHREVWPSRRLEENMAIALEPGIYIEGVGGYRLGNNFLVTRDGLKLMTNARALVTPWAE